MGAALGPHAARAIEAATIAARKAGAVLDLVGIAQSFVV
jgi:hypothetical protein